MFIRLREKRTRLEMPQKELSIESGVPKSSVSEIENGKRIPNVETALRIARALRCSVEDVFILEDGRR